MMRVYRCVSVTIGLLLFVSVAVQAQQLPAQLSDKEFWKMITDFSEPNGSYKYENFMSNEDDYQTVLPELARTAKANSIFIGVGPEQNFTYVSALKPKMAFVVDIRRQNMVEHLLYKALFELSSNRVEFVSRLFSRRAPSGLTTSSSAKEIFDAYEQVIADQKLFDANLTAAWDWVTKKHGFDLSGDDRQAFIKVYTTFFQGGTMMDFRFNSYTFPTAPVSYKALTTSTDRNGKNWSYLATEENFRVVQDYQKKNLIVPLVGDFAGPKALRAIGQYAREHAAHIGVFYTSNVDEYLFQDGVQDKFLSTIATFPLDPSSMMIRVNGGPSGILDGTFQVAPGKRWAALLSPLPELVKAFNAREIRTRTDMNWLSRR
jgi:hypothetical protein